MRPQVQVKDRTGEAHLHLIINKSNLVPFIDREHVPARQNPAGGWSDGFRALQLRKYSLVLKKKNRTRISMPALNGSAS